MELYFYFHETLWTICLFSEPAVQVSVTTMRSGDIREETTSWSQKIKQWQLPPHWWENMNRLTSFELKVFLPYNFLKSLVSSLKMCLI